MAAKASAAKKATAASNHKVENSAPIQKVTTQEVKSARPKIVKLDDSTRIAVKSNVFGELIFVNPRISTESLYDGVRNVAQDIMGTMINVLFLSYFCGAIPLILIKMINNYGFTEIFKFHM